MTHLGDLLSAHLDGELLPSERRRVVSHLQGCDRCRDELVALSAARAAVRSLPTLELPAVFVPEAAVPHGRLRPAWIAAAVAAVAAFVFGIAGLLSPAPQTITPPELAQMHLARTSATGALSPAGMAAVASRGETP